MAKRNLSSVELKVSNIKKLMKQIKGGKTTLKEAGINGRLEKLAAEGERGKIWAEDLQKDYINMVKNLNKK